MLDLQYLLRLVVAALLSALLGWERERVGKAAGLRTHMLVGITAALFMAMAQLGLGEPVGSAVRLDPLRVVQGVATGVGFLGAGNIIVSRNEQRVHGLTTAASIWATSAVGVACGVGRWLLAVGSALLLYGVMHGLRRFDRPRPLEATGDFERGRTGGSAG